jgi:hypothetical protein
MIDGCDQYRHPVLDCSRLILATGDGSGWMRKQWHQLEHTEWFLGTLQAWSSGTDDYFALIRSCD